MTPAVVYTEYIILEIRIIFESYDIITTIITIRQFKFGLRCPLYSFLKPKAEYKSVNVKRMGLRVLKMQ